MKRGTEVQASSVRLMKVYPSAVKKRKFLQSVVNCRHEWNDRTNGKSLAVSFKMLVFSRYRQSHTLNKALEEEMA